MVIDDEGDDPQERIGLEDRPYHPTSPRVLAERDKRRILDVYNQVANRHLDDICQLLVERFGLDVTADLVMEVVDEAASGGPVRVTIVAPSDRRPPGR